MADTRNANNDSNAAAEQSDAIPPEQERATAPSESEIAKNHDNRAAEYRERFIKRPIRRLVVCVDRHNGIITAVATAAIAALTFSLSVDSSRQADTARNQFTIMQGQLDEMRKQRLLTIEQQRANLKREEPEIVPIDETGKQPAVGKAAVG